MNENRQTPRQRVLKGGSIVFNGGRSTFDCTVRNLSPNGAKLAVASTIGVPAAFDLAIGSETPRACRVIWRTGGELGVVFTAP